METNVRKCLLTQMCEFLKQTKQQEDFIKMLKKNLVNDESTEEEYVWLSLLLKSCEICPMSLLNCPSKHRVTTRATLKLLRLQQLRQFQHL